MSVMWSAGAQGVVLLVFNNTKETVLHQCFMQLSVLSRSHNVGVHKSITLQINRIQIIFTEYSINIWRFRKSNLTLQIFSLIVSRTEMNTKIKTVKTSLKHQFSQRLS